MTSGEKPSRPAKKSPSSKSSSPQSGARAKKKAAKGVRTPHKVGVSDRHTQPGATPVVSVDDVKLAVRTVMKLHDVEKCDFSVGIVDDPTMHQLNVQYLQHDYPTDVLSFMLDDENGKLEGQIIVSADYAAREAQRHGWTAREELLLYIVHGSLHIVGFDDRTIAEAVEMRRLEREAFEAMGMSPPLWMPGEDV